METRDTAKAPLTVARLRLLQESCDGDEESVGDGQMDGQIDVLDCHHTTCGSLL